jgi:rRNA maturation RNase YbeY
MSNYKINVERVAAHIKKRKNQIKTLAQTVLSSEGILEAEINIIFVNDDYMLRLNQEYFKKNTTTDVISFNLTDDNSDGLDGEIYANVEQINRQASEFHVSTEEEIFRIVIHGLLHLLGFDDQTKAQKQIMTEKEDQYITLIKTKLKKRG